MTGRRIFDHIAKQHTAVGSFCKEGNSMRIAQRLSTAIHVANARAILKRMDQRADPGPDLWDLEAAEDGMDLAP